MRHDASRQVRCLGVDTEQCRQRLFRPPSPTALRRDAVIADVAARGLHALARALDAVRVMHESQVELRLGGHLEVVQRRKVRVVVAVSGHRHVHPTDGPAHGGCKRVRDRDRDRETRRLQRVRMLEIAVAEVVTYRYSGLLLESYAACLSSKPLSSQ